MISSKKNNIEDLNNDPKRIMEIFRSNEPNKNQMSLIKKQSIPLPPIQSVNNDGTLSEKNNSENDEEESFQELYKKKKEEKKRFMEIFCKLFEERKANIKVQQPMDLVGFEKDLKSDKYKSIQNFFNGTVCQHCIKQLEESYSHCLGKINFMFPSVNAIDEEKDGERIINTPDVFIVDEVKDHPTDYYHSQQHKIDTDKQLTYNTKIIRMKEGGPSFGISGKYCLDVTRKGVEEPYPGILFHDLDKKKDKEIEKLNRIILNLQRKLKDERDYTKQCKITLEKMKKSCLFVDTWKDLEESRLKDDVRQMRTQLSGFISYSFSQEREKHDVGILNIYVLFFKKKKGLIGF